MGVGVGRERGMCGVDRERLGERCDSCEVRNVLDRGKSSHISQEFSIYICVLLLIKSILFCKEIWCLRWPSMAC